MKCIHLSTIDYMPNVHKNEFMSWHNTGGREEHFSLRFLLLLSVISDICYRQSINITNQCKLVSLGPNHIVFCFFMSGIQLYQIASIKFPLLCFNKPCIAMWALYEIGRKLHQKFRDNLSVILHFENFLGSGDRRPPPLPILCQKTVTNFCSGQYLVRSIDEPPPPPPSPGFQGMALLL